MDPLETSIVNFVADNSGIQRNKALLTSRLSKDLGIEGLDAEELFKALAKNSALILQFSGIIGIITLLLKAARAGSSSYPASSAS